MEPIQFSTSAHTAPQIARAHLFNKKHHFGPLSPRVTHGATRAAVVQVPHHDPEGVCFVDWTATAQLGPLFAEADGLSSYRGLILMNKESEKEAYIRQHM